MTTGFDSHPSVNGAVDPYTKLLNRFPPRLIRSEEEYWETQAVMDRLIDQDELTDAEQDYLSLLGMLIARYDEEQSAFPELRGIPLVKALLNQLGLKQKDLLPIFKTESIVSAVLNEHRKLTTEHIDGLARFFQLPHHLFYAEHNVATSETPLRAFEATEQDLVQTAVEMNTR